MINKDSDIEIIISRYLSKESTAEDIKILDDWISATPENYKSFLAQKSNGADSPSKPAAGFRSS